MRFAVDALEKDWYVDMPGKCFTISKLREAWHISISLFCSGVISIVTFEPYIVTSANPEHTTCPKIAPSFILSQKFKMHPSFVAFR